MSAARAWASWSTFWASGDRADSACLTCCWALVAWRWAWSPALCDPHPARTAAPAVATAMAVLTVMTLALPEAIRGRRRHRHADDVLRAAEASPAAPFSARRP